jgi:hypothetical protein
MHSHEIHLRADLGTFRFMALLLLTPALILFGAGLFSHIPDVRSLGSSFLGLGLYHAWMWLRRYLQLRRFLKSLRRSPLATNHSPLFL